LPLFVCLALCLSLALAVLPALTTPVLAASTWYVDGTLGTDDGSHGGGPGGSAFRTIQYAIDDARVLDGDTIEVAAGIYGQNVVVDKSLILLGAQDGVDARGRVGSESTVGLTTGTAFRVTNAADNITIDGFSLIGGRPLVQTFAQTVTFVNNICDLTNASGSDGIVEIHGGAREVLIQHNDIVNSSVWVNPSANDLAVTIASVGAGNFVIDGNRLHNASGSGIGFVNVDSGVVTGSVTNNEIFDNRRDGIRATASDFDLLIIAQNDIHDNGEWGVNIQADTAGGIHINYNNIENNVLGGVQNLNGVTVDANFNWWGADDGPSGVGPGSGDAVTTYVDYAPYVPSQMCAGGAAMTTATGSGTAIFCPTVGSVQNLTPVSEGGVPPQGKPILIFGHGLFEFDISGLSNGDTVTLVITLPSAVPVGTQYWKYGPTPIDPTDHWYQIGMGDNDGDNIVTITLTDGGLGDDDRTANGIIIDQGGPGWPGPSGPGGGGTRHAPVFPNMYFGIAAAMGAGVAAYAVRRRLAAR